MTADEKRPPPEKCEHGIPRKYCTALHEGYDANGSPVGAVNVCDAKCFDYPRCECGRQMP